jgi:hypothetical protein
LTVEGDDADYWLAAGESFKLPRGARAWLSAGRQCARVALTLARGQGEGVQPVTRSSGWNWVPRWLLAG